MVLKSHLRVLKKCRNLVVACRKIFGSLWLFSGSNFEVSTGRVDVLLFDTMANNPSLCKLWTCVKALLLLSHGQASVERGFLVNKQVEIYNLSEDTIVAKRLICDHVTSVGGLKNIDTSNKALLLAASSARRKYMDYIP